MSEQPHQHDHQHDHQPAAAETPRFDAEYWDDRYGSAATLWSGHVNAVVSEEVAPLAPGRALDVGCGEGGDALWLAERGWRVLGVDVSQVALDRAAARAAETGLAERTTWEQRDLLRWSPTAATYDLVTACFIHLAPGDRRAVYAALAEAVVPGGTFLVAAHHPSDQDVVERPPHEELYFTADELVADLPGGQERWDVVSAEARPRAGTHGGQDVTLTDTVLVARRRR